MEDGLNSIIPGSHIFDDLANDCEPIESNDAFAWKREKELDENIIVEFDNITEMGSEDDEDDDESVNHSHHRHSYENIGSSHAEISEQPDLQTNENENSSSLSPLQSSHLAEQSYFSNEDSHHSHADKSSIHYDHKATEKQQNSKNTLSITANSPQENELHGDFISSSGANYNRGNSSIDFPMNLYEKHGIKSDLDSDVCGKYGTKSELDYSKYGNGNEFSYNFSEKHGTKRTLTSTSSSQFIDQPADLHEEFIKLQLLYDTRGKELEQVKKEEIRAKKDYSNEIKSLKLRLTLSEGEKDRLTFALQESQKLFSDIKHENNVLKGKLSALELLLSAEKEAKQSALGKLESCEITIQSLEQQINGITQSENVIRLQSQSESIMKDLKLRHQKEILQLKEEIDKLQENLNDKIEESNDMSYKMSKLQQKCEELLIEKTETFNKLSANLEVSQRQCQKLLESGTISEISILRLQVKQLQEEKSKLEKMNSDLKDEVKSLESELQTSETLKKLSLESEELQTDCLQNNKNGQSPKESSVKHDLKRSLKSIHTLRQSNNSLKAKLSDLKNQLPMWEEKAKLFESRFNESEKKAQELEKKLEDVLPAGSISMAKHEKELSKLKSELADIQKKYKDITGRYKVLASSEKNLFEDTKNLKSQIAEMLEKHTSDKIKAVEECREKYLELHESAVKNLKDDLTSKYDKEVKTLCSNYENKITELQKQIKLLNESLYDAKAQYVNIFEENRALQSRFDSISQPKEREEIENEVRSRYDKKLSEMKEQMQKQTRDHFEASVKQETERLQEEWTKQQIGEIKDFISATKQKLDDEFVKCIEKEQSKFHSELEAERERMTQAYEEKINVLKQQSNAEKERVSEDYEKKINVLKQQSDAERQRITQDYKEKLNGLKQQLDAEKESLNTKLRESFHLKWKNEAKDLQQKHQYELQSLTQKYEDTILFLKNKIESLKENLFKTSEDHQEVLNLQKEFSIQKQAWAKEKSDLIHSKQAIQEKLTSASQAELRFREKVKKYQRYVPSLEKKHQEEMDRLRTQKDELQKLKLDKENQLLSMREQHKWEVAELEQRVRKQIVGRNVESQTEEPVVSRKILQNSQDMFIQCLRKIADEMKTYLLNYRKRSAEHLQKALYYYHEQLTSKILQDMFKESSFMPSLYFPRINMNSHTSVPSKENISPITVQHQFTDKLSNSTPIDRLALNGIHKRLGSYQNEETNAKVLYNQKPSNCELRFEDVSFDFVPMRMPDSAFMSTKMPDYSAKGGLFKHPESIFMSSFPQKPSPISSIK